MCPGEAASVPLFSRAPLILTPSASVPLAIPQSAASNSTAGGGSILRASSSTTRVARMSDECQTAHIASVGNRGVSTTPSRTATIAAHTTHPSSGPAMRTICGHAIGASCARDDRTLRGIPSAPHASARPQACSITSRRIAVIVSSSGISRTGKDSALLATDARRSGNCTGAARGIPSASVKNFMPRYQLIQHAPVHAICASVACSLVHALASSAHDLAGARTGRGRRRAFDLRPLLASSRTRREPRGGIKKHFTPSSKCVARPFFSAPGIDFGSGSE